MGLPDLDARLDRLRAATARASENLMAVDRDDTKKLLEVTLLTGDSATGWEAANRRWSAVWTWLPRLTELLDDATELRGKRSWLSPDKEDRLAQLLTTPSIEVERRDVAVHDRDLLDADQVSTRCTPDEVLALMAEAYDDMRTVLGATATAWNDLVPRVADVRTTLDGIAQGSHGLDAELAPEIARLRPRCDALLSRIFADPLSVGPADVDTLTVDVDALRAQIIGATELRVELAARRARARTLLDAAREAAAEAAAAHELVLEKIAHPAVPRPATLPRDLADDLTRVEDLADRGEWRAAHTALIDWTTRAETAIERAHDDARANREPIEARNRLRGRLDAYQSMVGERGRLEDRHLADLHRAAEAVLYVAPCDLEEAEARVRRYREAIPEQPGSEGRRS